MEQQALFFEDVNEAVKALVQALGGVKKVAPMLRPELTLDGAATWLRDCTNPDRREKLSPEHMLLLMRKGREAGQHVLMAFIASDAGYRQPEPLEPEDEAQALMREYVHTGQMLAQIAARMEKVQDKLRPLVKVGAAN